MSDFRVFDPSECGKDGYPVVWHETLKHLVREQAGNRCVRCQHPYAKGAGEWSPCDEQCMHAGPVRWLSAFCPEDGWHERHEDEMDLPVQLLELNLLGREIKAVEARWRILTVHHLDGNKANCRWWNLAALCQRCHLQIQGKVQMARVWPWEHSEWFRPYVAGYYASVYLDEDLTREQVMPRLEELLALERVA